MVQTYFILALDAYGPAHLSACLAFVYWVLQIILSEIFGGKVKQEGACNAPSNIILSTCEIKPERACLKEENFEAFTKNRKLARGVSKEEMDQRWNQHSRVNLAELKSLILKRIGAEKAKLYFFYLNKFLDLKLTKVEFNKLCFRVLGKENIPLHNQLISSILKNACNAKVAPPPAPNKEYPTSTSDGSHTFPNGNVDIVSLQSTIKGDNETLQDGLRKPVQHHQVLFDRDKEEDTLFHHSTKLLPAKQSTDGLVSVQSKEQSEVSVFADRKEVYAKSSLVAPLGIPFCSPSMGGARKPLPLAHSARCASSFDADGLLDIQSLRERMQQIAASQGLEGVSMDTANLLNSGLDTYLKGLIKSCIELVGARRGCGLMTKSSHKHNSHGKLVNGFLSGHHLLLQNSSRQLDGMQEQRPHFSISLLDFKIAMELNPQRLGEDWPLLLEKITHAFEE
ncbi:uncharacterized protein LOC126680601 [Mercurialis annua]|uniref:uncharacterized protein LOC126680601 n=1 Tax=Mercurialis annua TaxID=3986 RepID=UPI00215FA7AA|nr:uncharacterized protein LOC126680601 [Mercurialis annua]